jgi:hypothetical protein
MTRATSSLGAFSPQSDNVPEPKPGPRRFQPFARTRSMAQSISADGLEVRPVRSGDSLHELAALPVLRGNSAR